MMGRLSDSLDLLLSPLGDNKAREGLERSVEEVVVGWVDGLRFGFGSLANDKWQ